MSDLDKIAAAIDKLFGVTPQHELVRGTAEVLAVSEPKGRAPYQDCTLSVVLAAPELPATPVTLQYVVQRSRWPKPGDVLAARIDPEHLDRTELIWG